MPEPTLFQKVVQYFQDDGLTLVLTEADVLFLRTKAPWRNMRDDITFIPALEEPNEEVQEFITDGNFRKWIAWGLDFIADGRDLNWEALGNTVLPDILREGDLETAGPSHFPEPVDLIPVVTNTGQLWQTQALRWLKAPPVCVWWMIRNAVEFAIDQLWEDALSIASHQHRSGPRTSLTATGSGEDVATCLRDHAKRYIRENYMMAPLKCGHRCGKRLQ